MAFVQGKQFCSDIASTEYADKMQPIYLENIFYVSINLVSKKLHSSNRNEWLMIDEQLEHIDGKY